MGSIGTESTSEKLLIVFNEPLHHSILDTIREKFPESHVEFHYSNKENPVPAELYRNATILVTLYDFPEVEDARHLKLIHSVSAGLDHLVDHPIVKETNVPITNSSGIHGPPMAEWTIMNWLIASHKYDKMVQDQKQHRWADRYEYIQGSHDQVGKKVGILGYGSIGRQIACICKAMGLTVYAYTASPRLTPESRRSSGYIVPGTGDPEGEIPESWHHGTDKKSIHEFLSLGLDLLVVCVPLTTQTTYLLGAEEFQLLSDKCSHPFTNPYVTNISRGKVIDQNALAMALKEKKIAFAALDVTDPEPLPKDHPLWNVPNEVISPHVSCMGKQYFPRSFDIVKINMGNLERGEPLLNAYERGREY